MSKVKNDGGADEARRWPEPMAATEIFPRDIDSPIGACQQPGRATSAVTTVFEASPSGSLARKFGRCSQCGLTSYGRL